MGGKTSTISNTAPRLGTLRIQTSMYGLAQRLMWGQPRVAGNLLWFGNFQAVPHTSNEGSGGKGGGGVKVQNTTFTYFAAAAMSLGRGPIAGIASAWKGKQRYAGATVGGTIRTLTHVATVPSGGGVISVPLAGAAFRATVSVARLERVNYMDIP